MYPWDCVNKNAAGADAPLAIGEHDKKREMVREGMSLGCLNWTAGALEKDFCIATGTSLLGSAVCRVN